MLNFNTLTMNSVVINVTIPADVYSNLIQFVSFNPKSNCDDFIADAISQLLTDEKTKLNLLLIEGYKQTRHEDLEICKVFEPIDFETNDSKNRKYPY